MNEVIQHTVKEVVDRAMHSTMLHSYRASTVMGRCRRGPSSVGVLFDGSRSTPSAPNIGLELFVPASPLRFDIRPRLF